MNHSLVFLYKKGIQAAVGVSTILKEGVWVGEQHNFTEDEAVFGTAPVNRICFKMRLQTKFKWLRQYQERCY